MSLLPVSVSFEMSLLTSEGKRERERESELEREKKCVEACVCEREEECVREKRSMCV